VQALVFSVGSQRYALPLADVVEVMRALPLTIPTRLPDGVLGTSLIRGRPTPVVDASQLLSNVPTRGTRWILMRVGARYVALAVDDIVGTHLVTRAKLSVAPPLLGGGGLIEAIGLLDTEFVHVLSSIRLLRDLPDESLTYGTSTEPEGGQTR
jgi:purine-binding chemotaxis protein CheW